MSTENRFNREASFEQNVIKLAEGNPGAVNALVSLVPYGTIGTFDPVEALDKLGIYGTDIYVLFADICGRNPLYVVGVLKAVELGIIDGAVVADAASRQDRSGTTLVNPVELLAKVREKDVTFGV